MSNLVWNKIVEHNEVPTDRRVLVHFLSEVVHHGNHHMLYVHWDRVTSRGKELATHWADVNLPLPELENGNPE